MSSQHEHRVGVATALAAVVVLSPDSLIVRVAAASDAGVIAWRGGLVAIAMLVVVARRGSVRERFRVGGLVSFAAGACWAIATILFVYSVRRTEVASTLVIVGAGPLFAAAIERITLHEPIPLRTWVASVAVLGGLAWIFAAGARAEVSGDLAALVGSLAFAAFLTLLRRGRAIDMAPSLVIGGAVTAAVGLVAGSPAVASAYDAALLAMLGLVILPVSLVLTTQASRRITAAEVSLLGRLEALLGPLWVWLALGDAPGVQVALAGAVIVAATSAHWVAAIRAEARGGSRSSDPLTKVADVDR